MKKINLLIVLLVGVMLITSCQKEEIQAPVVDAKKPQNMNELVASPTFNWKTTKKYQITITGNFNDVITIKSKSGIVFHKGFMKSGTSYKLNLTIPTSEKSIQLIYHGQDAECALTQAAITYSFN